MPRWTAIFIHGHGGVAVTLIAALAALFIWRAPAARRGSRTGLNVLVAVAAIGVLTELVLTSWYLFSPTYLDHIEASTASAAQYFRLGIALYPDLGAFTFHGLLYGPLLSELNSLGYWLGSGVFASKLVGWVAAWVAMGLILALPDRGGALGLPGVGSARARVAASAMVLFVLAAFGDVLTSDRADSLLLLFATAGLFCVLRFSGLGALAAVAALAGAAADLKLHGPIYLAPALYWWVRGQIPDIVAGSMRGPASGVATDAPRGQGPDGLIGQTRRTAVGWLRAATVAVVAGLAGLVLPLLPANVNVTGYLGYLTLAARHGLSSQEFLWNCVFLSALWAPIALVWLAVRRLPRQLAVFAGVLFALESIVCVIGAKPGAGLHHLIPFLGYHAFLLHRMLSDAAGQPGGEARASRGAVAALAAVVLGTAWPAIVLFGLLLRFDLQLPTQEATHQELAQLASRYPGGMLGVSDESSYALTNFRPWLTLTGTPQTDYGALMDLKLSGVTDEPLVLALAGCEIPYVFMPKGGAPFSLENHYGGPLFSEAVRAEFARRYARVEVGKEFDVYGCDRGSGR